MYQSRKMLKFKSHKVKYLKAKIIKLHTSHISNILRPKSVIIQNSKYQMFTTFCSSKSVSDSKSKVWMSQSLLWLRDRILFMDLKAPFQLCTEPTRLQTKGLLTLRKILSQRILYWAIMLAVSQYHNTFWGKYVFSSSIHISV